MEITLKMVLFYSTICFIILFISGIDSIMESEYLSYFIIISFTLIYLCFKYISTKELYKLLLIND